MNKNENFDIYIENMDVDGNGVGHVDGIAVFVHGALGGEYVSAKAIKVKKHYAVARINELIAPSAHRRTPPCHVYKQCGGCSVMHGDYAYQLKLKRQRVEDCMTRIGKLDIPVRDTIPSPKEFHYRNKAAYALEMGENGLKMGFYQKRSHTLCDIKDCLLQREEITRLMKTVRAWAETEGVSIYDETTHTGLLRHVVIRASHIGELMLVLVINSCQAMDVTTLIARVKKACPAVKNIVLSHHTDKGNVILGQQETVVYGDGYLTEEIEGLRFAISAHSFLQVNYEGMGLLYNALFEQLALSGQETVVDLYCGAGTISLLAAKRAKKVFGIEIVPEAVANAKRNAAVNGIENAEFFAGDAKAEFGRVQSLAGQIDVIIVDPPRKGLEAGVIDDIVATGAKKIGYVSCDPATMARDIALFYEKGYTASAIQPVDMFPQTTHVESVTVLSRKERDE